MAIDLSQVIGYDLKGSDVLYHYYEKFGTTDICIHSRFYFKTLHFVPKKGEWKALPLNRSDVKIINMMENKTDAISGNAFNVVYADKDFFSDISIEKNEFLRDSVGVNVSLLKGYYRITSTTFEIYDSDNHTVYYEYHSCK